MARGGQNARNVRFGWSNFAAMEAEECITTAGHFRCPYCGKEDEYHVVVYMEQDLLTHMQITECVRTTCCSQRIAMLSKN